MIALLQLSGLIILALILLLSDKIKSYKKLQERYRKKDEDRIALKKEIRLLVEGTETQKACVEFKYKALYEAEKGIWYGEYKSHSCSMDANGFLSLTIKNN